MAETTYLQFTKLTGTETAGYSSINTIIDSIDLKLRYKTISPGMIVIFEWATPLTLVANIPAGWALIGAGQTVSGLPTLTGNYYWIKKDGVV